MKKSLIYSFSNIPTGKNNVIFRRFRNNLTIKNFETKILYITLYIYLNDDKKVGILKNAFNKLLFSHRECYCLITRILTFEAGSPTPKSKMFQITMAPISSRKQQ